MKLTAVLLFAACMQVAARTDGQTVTLKVKNAPMKEVFREIQKQTGLNVMVDEAILYKARTVTLNVRDMPVSQVLNICLKNEPVTYTIKDGRIVVKPDPTVVYQPTVTTLPPPPIDIKGRVTNENKEPVAASIVVKGTQIGTTTNTDGYFELKNVDDNATLVITGVSIETREIKLDGKSEISITVKTRINALDEVIVNKGYYTETKKFSTGTTSKINSEEIERQPVLDPLKALQGKMAGVQIVETSGAPGSSVRVQIRGVNSIRSDGNSPFYIVDGVPYSSSSIIPASAGIIAQGSPFNSINPGDIESIEILKDADATAIYGSRGANGVVLITTKRGKSGEVKVNAIVSKGFGKASKFMKLLNTEQYLMMRNEAFANDGVTTFGAFDFDVNGTWDQTRYTDWQRVLFGGTANFSNTQLSLSGGNGNTNFNISTGYTRQTSIYQGDFDLIKLSTHFHIAHQSLNKKLNINFSGSYFNENNNLPVSDIASSAFSLAPNAPKLYNSDGTLNWENSTWSNPLASLNSQYEGKTKNLIIGSNLSYKIFKGTSLKIVAGYNHLFGDSFMPFPMTREDPAFATTGVALFGKNINETWSIEPQIETGFSLGKLNYSAIVGATIQSSKRHIQDITGLGYTNDDLLRNVMAATTINVNEINSEYKYNAVYARMGINYDQRFILNLTGRRDGSSRFGPGKQFANFGAVGTAWIISNENFFKGKLADLISFLKLKASYGTAGSDQIPDYGFLESYSATSTPYNGVIGFLPTRLRNENYRWELNKKFEVGLDIRILKDRLGLTINKYSNSSSNQLVGQGLSTVTGFSSLPYFNLPATVRNTGVEIELSFSSNPKYSMLWKSSFNISFEKNKLVSYPGIESSSFANTYTVGKSLFARKRYRVLGIDPATGIYTIEDLNKNGSIDILDRQSVHTVAPFFYGGWTNSFEFGQFGLDVSLYFNKQKGISFQNTFSVPGRRGNQPIEILDRWQNPGDNARFGKYTQSFSSPASGAINLATVSGGDLVITDASYISLRNVEFSYRLKESILKRMHLSACKFFVQAQNLLIITNYIGLSVETQSNQRIPPLRMFNFGFNVSF